jgi:hypothetical protein
LWKVDGRNLALLKPPKCKWEFGLECSYKATPVSSPKFAVSATTYNDYRRSEGVSTERP